MEDLIKQIKDYIQEKNVLVITPKDINKQWKQIPCEDYKEIINLSFITSKFIIMNIHKFNEEDFLFDDEIENKEKYEQFKKESYLYIGKYKSISLGCLIEDNLFFFIEHSNLSIKYEEKLLEFFKENKPNTCLKCGITLPNFYKEIKDDKLKICSDCRNEEYKQEQKQADEIAKIIAKDKKFFECKNPIERKLYIKLLYPNISERIINNIQGLALAINKIKKE